MSAAAASAVEVATRETLAWLARVLPAGRVRLLDVGCGGGEIAAGLAREGRQVVAIDASAKAVARAQERGVPAREACFPAFEPAPGEAPFEAVLFSRSLHHVDDLPGVCARAAQLLAPGGTVLVEDFAWELVDRPTAVWFYGQLRLVQALGLPLADEWDLEGEPLTAWRHRNEVEKQLHRGESMLSELAEHLAIESRAGISHAYRWVARGLEGDPRGYPVASAALRLERELIESGAIVPLGFRLIARRKP